MNTAMETQSDQDLAAEFRRALRGIAATVCVITAVDGNRRHGMTVTSMTSLTMEPPALLVCLNQSAALVDLARVSQGFCVNILSEGQEDVSTAFSGGTKGEERFSVGKWHSEGETGLPYLEDAQSVLFCRKTAAFPYGTHTILIGEVVEVSMGASRRPLIYQDASYATLQSKSRDGAS